MVHMNPARLASEAFTLEKLEKLVANEVQKLGYNVKREASVGIFIADIVITDSKNHPIAIIECKSAHVPVSDVNIARIREMLNLSGARIGIVYSPKKATVIKKTAKKWVVHSIRPEKLKIVLSKLKTSQNKGKKVPKW